MNKTKQYLSVCHRIITRSSIIAWYMIGLVEDMIGLVVDMIGLVVDMIGLVVDMIGLDW